MYWQNSCTAVITLAVLSAVVEGHDGILAPKLVGRRAVEELKARNVFGLKARNADPQPAPQLSRRQEATLEERANTDGPCGPGAGSCAAGYCCSSAGWCGQGSEYCAAPDCLFNYGSGCDTLKVPPGPKTSNIARTKVGRVAYGGAGVYSCVNNGDVAITYDDGPFVYTSRVLDLLDQYNAKATFFITGNNLGKGEIDNAAYPWAQYIQRMYVSGHQVASHTWGHQDLSKECTQAQRRTQMYNNEIAFNNILGVFPTYMRPPYSSCDSSTNGNCQSDMAALGYHVIYFDLDTEDYLLDNAYQIQQAKNDFYFNLTTRAAGSSSKLSISHDIHYQTAYNLTEFMLQSLQSQGFRAVTVGECLGDPQVNWYRTLGGGSLFTSGTNTLSFPTATPTSSVVSTTPSRAQSNSSKPAPKSFSTPSIPSSGSPSRPTGISQDATCGGAAGYTCSGSTFGNCCSVNGWCGSTSAYCSAGCQAAFGICGSSAAPAPSSTSGGRVISNDGSCGGASGFTCQGSTFGNCCSQYGYCGSNSDYCSTNCQAGFGTCSVGASFRISSMTSRMPVPLPP